MVGTPDSQIQRVPSSGKRPEDDELKPYVIIGDLGKGSFATETRHEVAIKTVSRGNLPTKLFENLKTEIDILKSLSRRHITKLINIIRAERNIYLIMEYCSGGDLTNYIKKRGRVENTPELRAAPHFLRQLARALKFLWQRNLIHRDIKPQNLLLRPPGEEDLAREHPLGVPLLKRLFEALREPLLVTCSSETQRVPSPRIHDAKADLWSVGAVLYEMSVGKVPFRDSNHIELLKKIDHSKGIKFPEEDPLHQPCPEEDAP
ncbi:Protein kinase-like domain containing protein [Lactarius tabidus]